MRAFIHVFIFSLVCINYVQAGFRDYLKKKGDCKLDINKINKKYEPLFLRKDSEGKLEIIEPDLENKFLSFLGKDKVINIKNGEKITIACIGEDNLIAQNDKDVVEATCFGETTVELEGGGRYDIRDIYCRLPVKGNSQKIEKKCGNEDKGTYIDIGFKVKDEFVLQFSLCHIIDTANTIFAAHEIHPGYLSSKRFVVKDPDYIQDIEELYKDIDMEKAYSKRNQEVVMTRNYGLETTLMFLESKTGNYWLPGPLVPPEGFLFDNLKKNTFFRANSVPMWPSIMNGYYATLEKDLINFANKMNMKLVIVTGALNLLDFVDVSGKAPMALRGKTEKDFKINVPSELWRIVYNPELNACIGFIISNNPFDSRPPVPLCVDSCKRYKWKAMTFSTRKGYVYCCDVAKMKEKIQDIPDLPCHRVLIGPK